MKVKVKKSEVSAFLNDYKSNSETYILEEGKSKEIAKIANKRGIELANSRDLAGFKTVYTFANQANKNRVRLPEKELLKALPSLIGKPVDIDHNRRYVIGYYIDYKYNKAENKVIAYGIFFKNCFEDEWEKAQKLFKEKKLTTSYEIWSDSRKTKELSDGTIELYDLQVAGGGLLFNEEPAFEDAEVLEVAKKKIDSDVKLIFANNSSKKYKNEELIMCDKGKCKIKTSAEVYQCECPKCGEKTSSSTHCNQTKCPKCGTMMRKEGFPGKGQPDKSPNATPQKSQIKCKNCGKEFEYDTESSNVKCPECLAILNQKGEMVHPPQIKNFKILCPSCQVDNWLILGRDEHRAKIQCLSCKKKYAVKFTKEQKSALPEGVSFFYEGTQRCYQCGTIIRYGGFSDYKEKELKCPKCGLKFSIDIKNSNNTKISEITEIDKPKKSSKEGGKRMNYVLEVSKYHRFVDNFEALDKSIYSEYEKASEKVSKRLTYKERQSLSDNDFAVVVKVKDKKTGKVRKIRKYPIHDKAHVRNALARIAQKEAKEALKKLGVSVEKVKAKIEAKAKKLGIETSEKKVKASKKESPYKSSKTLRKAVSRIKEAEKQVEEIKKASDKKSNNYKEAIRNFADKVKKLEGKVKLYESNAKKIVERRQELGDEYSKDLTDKDILNDDKFDRAKTEKENLMLKAKLNKSSDETVGIKPKDENYWAKTRKEIDELAFGKADDKDKE